MAKIEIKNLPKDEIEITLAFSPDEFKKSYEKIISEVTANAEIKGFRKGKAPRDLVEKETDKGKIYEEVFKDLLPPAYSEAVSKNNLQPVMEPQIMLFSPQKLTDIDGLTEIVFKAKTAQKPQVLLKKYKDKIKSLKAKASIWVPGKGPENKEDKKKQEPSLDEIISAILEEAEIELPPILVEHETQRFLGQTLSEIKRLGLTLDQYLSSTQKSVESLQSEAREKAVSDLKLEFILTEIAKEEKITTSQEDIDKVINENKDPKTKENLKQNSYLLAGIILQQKTLDFLKNL